MTRSSIGAFAVSILIAASTGCGGSQQATTAGGAQPADSTAQPAGNAAAGGQMAGGNVLLQPTSAAFQATPPDSFQVRFDTSKGEFTVLVHTDWAPNGAQRFYNLVRNGFFTNVRFFRVIDGFMAQFGMNGDPAVDAAWQRQTIPDDPVLHSNTRGTLTFAATRAPNSRGTQLFINLVDNSRLDGMRFAPIGEVTEGMGVVDQLYSGYGEGAPNGQGPDQGRIATEGNSYLEKDFPQLDYIKSASLVE